MEMKGLMNISSMPQIRGVDSITPRESGGIDSSPKSGKAVSFAEYLQHQIEETNQLGLEAENAIQRSVLGEETNPHQTMMAVQKADISLTLLTSIKDRLERAYTDLIRTPI